MQTQLEPLSSSDVFTLLNVAVISVPLAVQRSNEFKTKLKKFCLDQLIIYQWYSFKNLPKFSSVSQ